MGIKIKRYDITLLDDDININAREVYYGTINGMYGLQCSHREDSKKYNQIRKQCDIIHQALLAIEEEIKES